MSYFPVRKLFLIFLLQVSDFHSEFHSKSPCSDGLFPFNFCCHCSSFSKSLLTHPKGMPKESPFIPVQWAKTNSSCPLCHRPSLSMASVSDNCLTILPVKYILLLFLASKLNQFENPLVVCLFSIKCLASALPSPFS